MPEIVPDRGQDLDRIDTQCPVCGSIYLDASVVYAQRLHDKNEPCDGKLVKIEEKHDHQGPQGRQTQLIVYGLRRVIDKKLEESGYKDVLGAMEW